MIFLTSKFVHFKMAVGHKILHCATVFVCFVTFSKIKPIPLNKKRLTFAVDTSI
jgi:phosphatidylglycerophosphatase A